MVNLTTFKDNRSKITAAIFGIILIIGGFWIYKNFTKTESTSKKDEIRVEQTSDNKTTQPTGTVAGEKVEPGLGGSTESITWTARVISSNSLRDTESYQVQAGDTLWAIAEGKYGSGFDWHKILDANKDKVGFLPDGSQALIQVGQTLTLPK